MDPLPPLDALPTVPIQRVELVLVELPMRSPLVAAHSGPGGPTRPVLLVRAMADGVDGWAECAVEPAPTYDGEYTAAAFAALRDHLVPRALTAGIADVPEVGAALADVRGHHSARGALELAVLDAQLRVVGRSLADWIGAVEPRVAAGATLGLHPTVDGLLAEADDALAAGARRLRVKVQRRSAHALAALVAHVDGRVPVQADANGSFRRDDAELHAIDELGLACLEQPLAPDDLVGSAQLAQSLRTPICLDEPITSVGSLEAAAELGALRVACLKPGRVGGWLAARAVHHRARALGLGVWVGGMLETGVGRAANAAVAALPGTTAAPDLDPRSRYAVDLAEPLAVVDGWITVPDAPGTGAHPDPTALTGAQITAIRP